MNGWSKLSLLALAFINIGWSDPGRCNNAKTTPAQLDRLELSAYKRLVPELRARIVDLERERALSSDEKQSKSAYAYYLASYYKQESRLREVQIRVAEWQVFAANLMLGLVVGLTVFGVSFSGLQLWRGLANGKEAASVEMELSLQKVRVQSSVIGIAILTFAGLFLLLFLERVYDIHVVSPDTATHTVLAGSPKASEAAIEK